MGGGDLNLKKSWHPSTLRNLERVWKAEQRHEAEQKKIEQLQRELAEERAQEEMRSFAETHGVVKKRGEKLDWMYQGPAALVDREEYLMGRPVDKTFEIMEQHANGTANKQDNESYLGNILRQASSASSLPVLPVDMANKIREDPLFAIRKQEQEKKKLLLSNPIKMKQLHQLLQSTLSSKDKKSRKKKKHKKRKKSSSSSSSSESETSKEALSSSKPKHSHHSKEKYPSTYHEENSRPKHSDVSSRERELPRLPNKDEERRSKHQSKKYNSDSDDDHRSKKKENKYGLIVPKNYQSQSSSTASSKSAPQPYQGVFKRQQREPTPERKVKRSAEEMARLREEMLQDGKWREEQRKSQVGKYKKQDEEEEHKNSQKRPGKEGDANFIKPLLSKVAEVGSVENSIKRKIFNIQRSRDAMDSNFARR